MFKWAVICAVSITSIATLAQSRNQDIQIIERKLTEMSRLGNRKIPQLSDQQVRNLRIALNQAHDIMFGRTTTPPPTRVCLHDPSGQGPQAQRKIESVAKKYLGMFTFDAQDHAEAWMAKYPCSLADQYEINAQALFETAREVFDLFKNDAEEFTAENVEKVCNPTDLKSVAKSYYDLGRSRGMFSNEAEQYAQERVAKDGFYTCQFGQ